MDDTELDDLLDKLHTELQDTGDLDDDSRQRLQDLMGDIRLALRRDEIADHPQGDSLGDRLTEVIVEYEVTHPSLAAALRHALDILSGAGI